MIAINKCIYLAHLVVLSLVLRESQSAKNLKTVHVVSVFKIYFSNIKITSTNKNNTI